jgi:hypothetical protein
MGLCLKFDSLFVCVIAKAKKKKKFLILVLVAEYCILCFNRSLNNSIRRLWLQSTLPKIELVQFFIGFRMA